MFGAGGMQKKLATNLGPTGLEFEFYFRENLICNKTKTTLHLGTGHLSFSLAILLPNPVILEPSV